MVAAAAGGPLSLIEDRVSGILREPDTYELADAVIELAAQPRLRARLARGGLESAGMRTWERAFARLAAAYRRVLGDDAGVELARAA